MNLPTTAAEGAEADAGEAWAAAAAAGGAAAAAGGGGLG